MYRITTYLKYSRNPAKEPWEIDKVKLYDNISSFNRGRNYYKSTFSKWAGYSAANTHRILCEEFQNNNWIVIEDWSC